MEHIILSSILLTHLIETIEYVHYCYKKQFTKKDKDKLIELVTQKLTLQKQTEKEDLKIANQVKKKIISRKIKNKGIYIPRKNIPNHNNRCQARIWAQGLVSIKKEIETNGKEIKKIQYGTRCSRKKTSNSNYCFQHLKNNPHGDYDDSGSQKLIVNYQKHSKLLK